MRETREESCDELAVGAAVGELVGSQQALAATDDNKTRVAAAMAAFVRLLFGVDLASEAEIHAEIEQTLGCDRLPGGGVALRWGLLVATGRRAG